MGMAAGGLARGMAERGTCRGGLATGRGMMGKDWNWGGGEAAGGD